MHRLLHTDSMVGKEFLVELCFVKVHWLGHWLDNSSLCHCPLVKQSCMRCKWLPKNLLRLAIFAIVFTQGLVK